MIQVLLPSQLQSYSAGASRVAATGDTVDDVLRDLDRQFTGIRFRIVDEQDRIRRHIRIYHGREPVGDLRWRVADGDEILIFGALSGG